MTHPQNYRQKEGRIVMLRKVLAVAAFMAVCQTAAGDQFLNGVQVFNRTIDYDMMEQGFSSLPQRDSIYDELFRYTADLSVDIVRGGPRYADISTQTYRGWGSHGLYSFEEYLLPALRKYGIKNIDWVLVGTYSGGLGDDRDTNAEIVRTVNDIYGWPPESERWKALLSKADDYARTDFNGIKITYEIWNEPDINDTVRGINYWLGTRARYWQMFDEASGAVSGELINGGLVINDPNTESGYMDDAIQALLDGKISMLAIHRHGTIRDFIDSWLSFKPKLDAKNISASKVILNESGYAIPYGDKSRASQLEQAVHSAGKLMAAKVFGLGGAVVFHLGGLSFGNGANSDLLYDGDFSLIDFENGKLTPRIGYYALKTAIKFTKGLEAVQGYSYVYPDNGNGEEGYLWGFESEDGRKTLVSVKCRPDDESISEFFGDGGYDAEYNISGEEIPKGTGTLEDGIVYFVRGRREVLTAIEILTEDDELSGKQGEYLACQLRANTEGVFWTCSGLPAGISCTETGLISGTPTVSGDFTFSAKATKAGMATAEKILTLTIDGKEPINPETPTTDEPQTPTIDEPQTPTIDEPQSPTNQQTTKIGRSSGGCSTSGSVLSIMLLVLFLKRR